MTRTLSLRTRILNACRALFMLPFFEALLVRLTEGKSSNHFLFRLLPNHYQFKQPTMRFGERRGIQFELDISNWNDWEIYFNAQDASIQKLFQLAQPGDTIIDVGANIGYTAFNLAKNVLPTGKVYAFEPTPLTFAKLNRNMSLNSFNNIEIFNEALGSEAGSGYIVTTVTDNLGRNKIQKNDKDGNVRITTLDEFVRKQCLTNINLIKIDVEGFELHVLKGALLSIEKFRPTMFIEISDENLIEQGTTPYEVLSLVSRFGYNITNIRTQRALTLESDFSGCHFDALCEYAKHK